MGKTRKVAFTLAEVLITLGIIGVVAAITMPTLIANYQKHVTITKLKKVYSVLSQGFQLSQTKNDEYKYWDTSLDRVAFAEKYRIPFLNGAKRCETYSECGYEEACPWQTLGGQRKNNYCIGTDVLQFANYILPDGTFLRMNNAGFHVDLNGGKGPNIYGKDFFYFSETEKGIMPSCYSESEVDIIDKCSMTRKDGACCSTRLMMLDNWQIKDDYPW